MTRGDVENVLLEDRADKINTWTMATVFLGNQPGGYKVGEMSLHTHTPHTHTNVKQKCSTSALPCSFSVLLHIVLE